MHPQKHENNILWNCYGKRENEIGLNFGGYLSLCANFHDTKAIPSERIQIGQKAETEL